MGQPRRKEACREGHPADRSGERIGAEETGRAAWAAELAPLQQIQARQ